MTSPFRDIVRRRRENKVGYAPDGSVGAQTALLLPLLIVSLDCRSGDRRYVHPYCRRHLRRPASKY